MDIKSDSYLDIFDGFSEIDSLQSPLGFQKIYKKKILTQEDEEFLMVYNEKYQFRSGSQGLSKPISKIVNIEGD